MSAARRRTGTRVSCEYEEPRKPWDDCGKVALWIAWKDAGANGPRSIHVCARHATIIRKRGWRVVERPGTEPGHERNH